MPDPPLTAAQRVYLAQFDRMLARRAAPRPLSVDVAAGLVLAEVGVRPSRGRDARDPLDRLLVSIAALSW